MVPTEAAVPAPVVISLGGSVLFTGQDDRGYLDRLADLLLRTSRSQPLLVTTGGGRTAREYIQLGRELGLTEVELDEIGIDVTRLHARLLAGRLGPPAPAHPPTSVREAVDAAHRSPVVVLGGTEPGHTTDGVAALLAVRLRSPRLINATDVDGLYDADPRTHPTARRIERASWNEFRTMVRAATSGEAGQQFVFDRLGAEQLARAGIPLWIVSGRDLPNLEAAILGRSFSGSRVEGSNGGEGGPGAGGRSPGASEPLSPEASWPRRGSRHVPRTSRGRKGDPGRDARPRARDPPPLYG